MNYVNELGRVIFNYRGCLIKVVLGGYEVLGQSVATKKEVDEVIDGHISILIRSLNRIKPYLTVAK